MKRVFLICALFAFSAAWCRAGTVFDTFGPGNTYAQSTGYAIAGPSSTLSNTFESAAQFVAQASGALSEIDLGLNTNTGGPVNVYLEGDAGGSPDSLSQILLGTVTPTHQVGTTNSAITSLFLLDNTPVSAGTTYWLVLKPGSSTTFDTWNQSLGTSGMQEFSHDDMTWGTQNSTLAAFRISAAVPEAPPLFAMVLTSITVLFYGRGGFRFRRRSLPS